MGLMFFFYDVGTIVNPAPMEREIISIQPVHNTPEKNFPDSVNEPTTNNNNLTLHNLLNGFDRSLSEQYSLQYQQSCELQSYLCSSIQNQLNNTDEKKDYFALFSLLTINELNNLLLTSDPLQTTLIIKNDPDHKKRWYATKQSIVINTYTLSEQEFFEVLVHELGHTLDLWVLQGEALL